jgi:hypothetical protein
MCSAITALFYCVSHLFYVTKIVSSMRLGFFGRFLVSECIIQYPSLRSLQTLSILAGRSRSTNPLVTCRHGTHGKRLDRLGKDALNVSFPRCQQHLLLTTSTSVNMDAETSINHNHTRDLTEVIPAFRWSSTRNLVQRYGDR